MAGNYGTASAIAGGAFRPGVCEFDIAVVKVVDEWQCDRFTDYLTMLKHDGKWSIVNKAFTVHPK
jgi:hypothetical protein